MVAFTKEKKEQTIKPFTFTHKECSAASCGTIKYKLIDVIAQKAPAYLTLENEKLILFSNSTEGVFEHKIKAYPEKFPANDVEWAFKATITNACSSPTIVLTPSAASSEQTYEIGSSGADLLTKMPTFTTPDSPGCTDQKYTFETTVTGSGVASAAKVQLTGNPPTFLSFEVTDPTYGGETFTVVVTATIGGSKQTFTVTRTIAEVEQKAEVANVTLEFNETVVLNETVEALSVNVTNSTEEKVENKMEEAEEKPEVDETGAPTVKIETQVMSKDRLAKYAKKLKLKREENASKFKLKLKPKPKFTVIVQKPSSTGEFGLGFSMPCAVFGNGKMPGSDELILKFVRSTGAPAPVTDKKDKTQKQKPKKKQKLSGSSRKLVESQEEENEEDDTGGFTWECTEFTEKGLKFKMGFKSPLSVSSNNGAPDKLKLQLAPKTFFAKDSLEELSGDIDLDIEIPKQFPSVEEKQVTEGVAGGIKNIMAANLIVTFVFQFFFSQVLKRMWPLFNVIQLLVALTVLEIETPANTTLVLTEIKNAIEMNSIPKDQIKEYIVNVPALQTILKSGGILALIGIPLILIGILLLACVIRMARYNLKCYKLLEKVKKAVFWGIFLRMMIVTYLSMVIATNIGRLFKLDHFKDTNLVLLVYITAVIQGTGMFLYYSEHIELSMPSMQDKFGTLYNELRTKNFLQLMHTPIFFARRLCFVFALQTTVFSLKYGGVVFCSMFFLCFLLHVRPQYSHQLWKLEVFNELLLLLLIELLPLFTGWVTDVEVRYQFGWTFVYCLGPLFMLNIGYVIIAIVDNLSKKLKKRQQANKQKKIKKMQEEWNNREEDQKEKIKKVNKPLGGEVIYNRRLLQDIQTIRKDRIQREQRVNELLGDIPEVRESDEEAGYPEFKKEHPKIERKRAAKNELISSNLVNQLQQLGERQVHTECHSEYSRATANSFGQPVNQKYTTEEVMADAEKIHAQIKSNEMQDAIKKKLTKAAEQYFDQMEAIEETHQTPIPSTLTDKEQEEKDQKKVKREAGRAVRKLMKQQKAAQQSSQVSKNNQISLFD